MKKALLLLAMSSPLFLKAQSLQNTNFENWNIVSFDNLTGWMTSNEITIPQFGIPNATKVTPGVTNSALKLETIAVGQDTILGFITNSDDPLSGDGGFPYSQKPTGLSGSFRYSIPAGDTARIFIGYKNSGIMYAQDMISIWGTQSTFALNNYPLPGIMASGTTPDSVIIAVGSSDFMNGFFKAGSVLEVDNLVFTGPGITQGINGDFDNWVADTITILNDWDISGEVTRTTDAFSGTYAAKLMTTDQGFGPEAAGIFQSFVPSQNVDTLIGWYKYIPKGNDSASIELNLFNTSGPSVTITKNLGAAANYTQFKIPMTGASSSMTDAFLVIQSSLWSGAVADSSTLYIDSIVIKPEVVGVKDVAANATVRVFPNPAKDILKVAVDKYNASEITVAIYNAFGSKVYANTVAVQGGEVILPVKQLAAGIYVYEVKIGDAEFKGRFMKD